MELVIIFIALAAFAAALWVAAKNATTICVLTIDAGKVTVTRGKIAPRILGDVRDVVRRPKVSHAVVRVTRERGRAKVTLDGDMTEEQEQQIRNVIGSVGLAKLINAR